MIMEKSMVIFHVYMSVLFQIIFIFAGVRVVELCYTK
jgi:hypothetical protein